MDSRTRILSLPQFWLALVSLAFLVAAMIISGAGSAITNSFQSLISPATSNDHRATIPIKKKQPTEKKPANSKPMLALSFDDGPNPLTTPKILDILEKNQVQASFFVVGSRVGGNEKTLQRMYRDGDDIGNHSWNHPNFANLSRRQIVQQITKTEKVIAEAGVPAPFMFRPPYGVLGDNFPNGFPLATILWNVDPEDWADHDAKSLTKRIINQAKPGHIVDLHGIYKSTVEAVKVAIPKLKQHYQLVTVSQLMKIKPGATGKFYGYYNK